MTDPDPLAPTAFDVFPIVFAVVAALVLAGFVYILVSAARSRKVLRDAGHDPSTLPAELAVRAMKSDLLASRGRTSEESAPRRTVEERLAEVGDLHARGVISSAEHAEARARIISAG